MRQVEKISSRQFTVLVFWYTIGTTILVIPSGLAATAKQDAWIGVIAGIILNIAIVFVFIKIWSKFPDLSYIGICKKVLGKYFGKVLAVNFIFYSLFGSAAVLFYVGDFVTTNILVGTPISYIHILYAVVVIMGVKLGIEVIARTAEIFLPWFIFLYLLFVIMIGPNVKFELITPVFDSGVKPILQNAMSVAGTASLPFLSFLMIFPKVNNFKEAKKGFYVATIIGGLFILIITFLSITVLGPELTSRNMYPTYVLAKKINIGNFLQRIEIIIAIIWIFSSFFKLTIYYYGLTVSIAELFNIQNYRSLCYPLGVIVVVVSLFIYPNITYMIEWDSTVYIPYIYTVALLIPLFILIVYSIRSRITK